MPRRSRKSKLRQMLLVSKPELFIGFGTFIHGLHYVVIVLSAAPATTQHTAAAHVHTHTHSAAHTHAHSRPHPAATATIALALWPLQPFCFKAHAKRAALIGPRYPGFKVKRPERHYGFPYQFIIRIKAYAYYYAAAIFL
jgi:hypothetical protein